MQIKLPFIRFMDYSKKGLYFSAILTGFALLFMIFRGFNFGLELTGGATIELQYRQSADIDHLRTVVEKIHPEASVIQYGSSQDVQIRFKELPEISTDDMMVKITEALRADNAEFELVGQAKIGGQYREELVEKGLMALLLSSIGMVIYLGLRFEWKFALGAVVSQLHDVIITAFFFSLFQWTFDLTVLGALLAVLGYSVNDTVVVYDRIRENFLKMAHKSPQILIDEAINQTLARTSITSLTTLLSVIALLVFGGSALANFAIALIIGIIFGTYSSIFVASSLVHEMGVRHEDLLPKERAPIDDLP